MNTVDLIFPVVGNRLPTEHGYALYASLAKRVPALHATSSAVSISPVTGDYLGRGMLSLNRRSSFRCRLPASEIAALLPLAGQALEVTGHRLRLGAPRIQALVPATALVSRLVILKIHDTLNPTPEQFLEAVRRRLADKGIVGEPQLPLVQQGPHAGRPQRRTFRIKDNTLAGYALQVSGLTAEDSLQLQADSPFGRRRMGCGFFVPLKEDTHDEI